MITTIREQNMLYFKGFITYDCVMLCTWSLRVYNGNEIL